MKLRSSSKRTVQSTLAEPALSLIQAAQRVVEEHGWDEVTRSLADAARDASAGIRPGRSGSTLAPVFDVLATVPRSAWTPVLAPLVAAGLTTFNQPQIDKAGAAETAKWAGSRV